MLLRTRSIAKQYTYITLSQPDYVTPELLALVKEHLRLVHLNEDDTEDNYLSLLINVVFKYAESYTRLTLINTSFRTFRDSFNFRCFELRRTPLQSLTSIKYYKDNILQTVNTDDYYNTTETYYTRILRTPSSKWNFIVDNKQQAIEIDFIAGFGPDYTYIPSDLLMAMLQHIAKLYESRGDCDGDGCAAALPSQSKMIYDMYKIFDVTGELDCGCDYGYVYSY